jgi:hypothetical protein
MPAPIIGGMIQFLNTKLAVTVWDGEVPRLAANGKPVAPDNPANWPAIKLFMPDSGFDRHNTTEDPYDDEGEVLVQCWGTSRVQAESVMNQVEALLVLENNWALIQLGGPSFNPFVIVQIILRNWCSVQEPQGQRTAASVFLYRCDMHYKVTIHGDVLSFQV